MYLDRQLWAFTAGARARILAILLLGLLAVSAGIVRLGLLGWLLGRVLGRDSAARPDRTRRGRGVRDRPSGGARLCAGDGGPRHGRPRPGAPARDGARTPAHPGPGALHRRPDGRRHPVRRGGSAAARGVLRSVPAPARRGGVDARAHLRLHGVARTFRSPSSCSARRSSHCWHRASGIGGTAREASPGNAPTACSALSSSTRCPDRQRSRPRR